MEGLVSQMHHTTAGIMVGEDDLSVDLAFKVEPGRPQRLNEPEEYPEIVIESADVDGEPLSDDLFDEHEDALVAACWAYLEIIAGDAE